MAINKKLIHFLKRESFDRELEAGNILETSICFIKDSQQIYTHEQFYNCDGLSEDEINKLIESYLYEPDTNGYEYVDMGEAGIWAKYPIGVSEWNSDWKDNIKYFAWGETEGYTKSQVGVDKQFSDNWSDYKWGNASNQLTKYCSNSEYGKDGYTDDLTVLLPEDDACTVNMGGNWRMPTRDEFNKLINLCDIEWQVYNYNGVSRLNGIIFKLKTDESKQLFLPAASICLNGLVDVSFGWMGCFLSSSLIVSKPSLYYLLNSDLDENCLVTSEYRYYGCPVVGFLESDKSEKYLTKKEAEDFATKEEVNSKADKENTYNKEEVDDKLSNIEITDLTEEEVKDIFYPKPTIYYTTIDGNQISDAGTRLKHIISHTQEDNGEYKIVLDNTMTSIPERCFNSQKTLKTIKFENFDNVISIKDKFLFQCESLQSINLSSLSNVNSIGGGGFLGRCYSLQSIDLTPLTKAFDTMKNVPTGFLYYCESLPSIDLTSLRNTTSIDTYFLQRCTSLVTITMPNTTGITSIGSGYLDYCDSLTTIYCPKGTLEHYQQLMPDRASIMVELDD